MLVINAFSEKHQPKLLITLLFPKYQRTKNLYCNVLNTPNYE